MEFLIYIIGYICAVLCFYVLNQIIEIDTNRLPSEFALILSFFSWFTVVCILFIIIIIHISKLYDELDDMYNLDERFK